MFGFHGNQITFPKYSISMYSFSLSGDLTSKMLSRLLDLPLDWADVTLGRDFAEDTDILLLYYLLQLKLN